jgi:hypothetical protein
MFLVLSRHTHQLLHQIDTEPASSSGLTDELHPRDTSPCVEAFHLPMIIDASKMLSGGICMRGPFLITSCP